MLTYSIVIPVYNAEKYLESCIDSVFAQRSPSAYEVILVNDGSKDRSPRICDRYAEQNACVQVIHQVNQGVSAARNAGIAAAKGQYVLFLDGDDLWDCALLSNLDQYVPDAPDMIEFGFQIFGEKGSKSPVLPLEVSGKTSGIEYFEEHAKRNRMPIGSSCVAAFRRQFLIEHELRFPLGVSYGEDFTFHMHCLKRAQSVVSICEPLYRYRANESSATHTPTVKKTRDMLSACAAMYRLFPCALLADHYCMRILFLAKLSRKDAVQVYDLLRENRDILRHISAGNARIACVLYSVLGWYCASRVVRFLLDVRH